MAQNKFIIEQGLKIVDAGTSLGVEHIQGSGAPSMDAPVGSLYSDRSAGSHYQKVSAGAGAGNWKQLATTDDVTASIGTWRPENVVCVSSEVIIGAAFTRDLNASPFSDDDDNTVSNSSFVQGDYAILNNILFVVTAASLSGVTFDVVGVTPLAKDDTFVCRHYLPDPVDQENHAIVNFNGSTMVKIADADWGRADAIGLAPSYAAVNGTITSADTVNDAIQKLDGNQQDLITLSGVAQGAEDLGVFTGTTIADGQTVKAALQDLETAHEGLADDVGHLVTLSGVAVDSDDLGVFTGTTIADGQTIKAALQDLETAHEGLADDVGHLVTLSGVAVDSDDLGTFNGDIIADGQTVKAALQDLEDITGNLVSQSGLLKTDTGYPNITDGLALTPFENNHIYAGTIAETFAQINYGLSPLMPRTASITDDNWLTIYSFVGGEQDTAVKMLIVGKPQHNTQLLPLVMLELVAIGGNGDCDYSVYAKLKTTTRAGVPVTQDFNLEARAIDDLGTMKIQVRDSSFTSGGLFAVEVRYSMQPLNDMYVIQGY